MFAALINNDNAYEVASPITDDDWEEVKPRDVIIDGVIVHSSSPDPHDDSFEDSETSEEESEEDIDDYQTMMATKSYDDIIYRLQKEVSPLMTLPSKNPSSLSVDVDKPPKESIFDLYPIPEVEPVLTPVERTKSTGKGSLKVEHNSQRTKNCCNILMRAGPDKGKYCGRKPRDISKSTRCQYHWQRYLDVRPGSDY